MEKEQNEMNCCGKDYHYHKKWHGSRGGGGGGAIYCLGVIGAAVFFIGKATTFWLGALGLLKAFFWPAIFVYEVCKLLIK